MTLFLLIRHAVTDVTGKRLSGSLRGIHLSEEGREQAARLAERLTPVRFTGIYSSPLERCVETAEAIAVERKMKVEQIAELDEVGYGLWSGRPLAQLARTTLWKQLQQAPSTVRFPDGETLFDVQRRSAAALEALAQKTPRATVAVVTHADVIRLVLAHFGGIHIDLFQRFTVSPTSVSAVVLGDRIPRILRINDTGTVADLAAVGKRLASGQPYRRGGNGRASNRAGTGRTRKRT